MRRLILTAFSCLLFVSISYGQSENPSEPIQKVGPDVRPPVPISAPEAKMPAEAQRSNTSGLCIVSMIVATNGMPQNPTVIRCTDPIFEQNSLDAVSQYRFKPARMVHGDKPVPVKITVEINFRFGRGLNELPVQVGYALASPPGTTTLDPDGDGIYPLSQRMELPKMTQFVSRGYSWAAVAATQGTACTILLVLDAKGKPQSAKVEACDWAVLSKPAVDSLMKSKFTPARLNGNPVPVRFTMKLVYEGFGTAKK